MHAPPIWQKTRSCRRLAKLSSSPVHRLTSAQSAQFKRSAAREVEVATCRDSTKISAQFSLRPDARASIFLLLQAEWAIPSRRADQGGDCRAAEIQRIAHLHCQNSWPIRAPRRRCASEQSDELAPGGHGLLPGTRCASLQQAQDAPEAPAGPWGRPESF